jgi:hypothetical protein
MPPTEAALLLVARLEAYGSDEIRMLWSEWLDAGRRYNEVRASPHPIEDALKASFEGTWRAANRIRDQVARELQSKDRG